jgi:redox-sensing transcriptional repressor
MVVSVKKGKISELTVNRLSVYLRCLSALEKEGVQTVSSQIMADRYNLNSAQIRKDLAYFGEFGVRGVGYYVGELRKHLRAILGVDAPHNVGIIGAGNLGTALANYEGFRGDAFRVVALFDNDPAKIGLDTRSGITVRSLDQLAEVVRREAIDIVAIAVPAGAAQQVLEFIVAAGVRAVLNFAPLRLKGPAGVKIKNVDLTISLESLSYALARPIGVELLDDETEGAYEADKHEVA